MLKKLCGYPGCRRLCDFGQRYCDKHQETAKRDTDKRASASERGYTSAWRRAAKQFLADNPLCAECARQGKIKPAQCVDHITPHKGNKVLFWDESNWQPLCNECHSRKTAREDGGFGNRVREKFG